MRSGRPHARRTTAVARAVPGRVWLLNAALLMATGALLAGPIRHGHRLEGLPFVPWWAVALGFLAAEVFVVHVQFRQEAHTFSLSEIPLVIGLFVLSPRELILAQVVGAAIALVLHRGQPLVKLVFNIAHLALEAEVAVLVFRAVAGSGDGVGAPGWAGAFAATLATTLIGAFAIFAAISLAEGRSERDAFPRTTGAAMVGAACSTSVALLVVVLMARAPEALWLMAVPSALLVVMYRGYTAQLQRHQSLRSLYEATRTGQESIRLEEVLVSLLDHARGMFRADVGEILFFADAEGPATRTVVGPGREAATLLEVTLDPAEGVWARVASEGQPLLLRRPMQSERLQAYFAEGGIRDAMVAPLMNGSRVVGMMTVANRRGDVTSFTSEELQLFETLANHASVSIENARLVRRLEESLEYLTQMNRLKDDFVATVSHELRTPLTSVQGTIKTLLRARSRIDADTEQTLLEAADRQSDRLRQLIENLLMVSRIESHQVLPHRETVSVWAVADRVVEETGASDRVDVELERGLPTVETDEGKVHQIVLNLVDNALKYSPRDARVTVRAARRGEGVVISIEDHGPGIPAELRDRIFDRFYQVDQSSTRSVGGTGLGLYICRQLATALDGRLWVERSDVAGSVFSLWLPRHPATPAEKPTDATVTQLRA